MDDDFSPPVMGPAIPSRKTGELQPLGFPGQIREPQRDRRAAGLKAAKTRRLNKLARERAANEKKRKPRVHVVPRTREGAPPRRKKLRLPSRKANIAVREHIAKNPNRPLELKNQLHAVLRLTRELTKAELNFFTIAVDALERLPKPSRTRVLEALGRVYA